MTRKIIGIALVALFVVSAAAVCAEDSAAKNLSLSLGAFRPTASGTRDTLGDTWWDVNLAYRLPSEAKTMGGWVPEIGIGYIKANGKTLTIPETVTTVKTKAQIIPVTLNLKKNFEKSPFYLGGGIGAYFTKVSNLDGAGVPAAATSKSKTKFGYQLMAGYNFTPNVAVELGWAGIGKTQAQKLDGMSLSIVGKF